MAFEYSIQLPFCSRRFLFVSVFLSTNTSEATGIVVVTELNIDRAEVAASLVRPIMPLAQTSRLNKAATRVCMFELYHDAITSQWPGEVC